VRTDPGCIFCRIVAGEIPSERVFEDEHVIVIRDIQPQAPTHLLVIPREHVASLSALNDTDNVVAGAVLLAARRVASEAGVADSGYRVVINTGDEAGQTVSHLHAHVLGGRRLGALG